MKKILNNQLGTKFAFVLFLFVLLQIPLSMVTGLISERSYRQDEVRNDIARSSSGEQRIIGPFIMVNYTETSYRDDKVQIKERRKFLLPSTFDMSANLDSFEKYRGIYRARLYKAQVAQVAPGTGLDQLPQGFHSDLTLADLNAEQPLAFDLNFLLQGMGQLQVTPIGSQTTVELSSTWAHPSFIGDYLPVSSEVSEDGFNAQWASNNFSTNIAQLFQSCLSSNHACHELEQRQMGVDLIDPVDHYLKSHRAVNYSQLVITLVFASFFLLELFQARPVHPVQYGFIGLALALFYLLLISMSEHLGFNWAYVVSAVASTGLLSVYVSGMLSNTKHGAIFGACLLTLYGLLFGLLQAESYALVMGTLLCFAILSFTMVITRNIDWYARNKKAEESAKANHEDV
ncbi:cell envelope integrity protein CreD [Vibrio harveyi]|uniref:cell envelope integrity protein CreD n=1 Tax=Vibrio harveyi TaxID=669 RepID=UPI002F42B90E